jgi:hypothetical protein
MSACFARTNVHAYRMSGTVALPSQEDLAPELTANVPTADAAWALMCETVISYWSYGEDIPYLLAERLKVLEFYRHRVIVVDGISSEGISGPEVCERVAAARGVLSPAARAKEANQTAEAAAGSAVDRSAPADGAVAEPADIAPTPPIQAAGGPPEELPKTTVPFGSFDWKPIDENKVEVSAIVGVWSPADGVETDDSVPTSRYRFTLRRAQQDGETYFDLNSNYARNTASVEVGERALQRWFARCGSDCGEVEHQVFSRKETLPGTVDFEYQRREGFADLAVRLDVVAMSSMSKPPRFGLTTTWQKGVFLSTGVEYLLGLSDPTDGRTNRFEELGRLGLHLGVGLGFWRGRVFNSGIETTDAGRLGAGLRISGGISEGPVSNFEANARLSLDVYLGSHLPGLTAAVGVLRTQGETQRLLTAGLKLNDPTLGIAGMTLALTTVLVRFAILGLDRAGI